MSGAPVTLLSSAEKWQRLFGSSAHTLICLNPFNFTCIIASITSFIDIFMVI